MYSGIGSLVFALVFGALVQPAIAVASPATDAPRPCVGVLYSSWPDGGYRYRNANEAIFRKLGWTVLRFENTHVKEFVNSLDQCDIVLPGDLYNYEHRQDLAKFAPALKHFLERGGILVAVDANYGPQIGWLGAVDKHLSLTQAKCDTDAKHWARKALADAAKTDPFALPPTAKTPWGHFAKWGPGWTTVLGRCPHNLPVCLRAYVGNGVLVATTCYRDCGFPTEEYLHRIWTAQWPRLMDRDLSMTVDIGVRGPGRNCLTVMIGRRGKTPFSGKLVCELRTGGAPVKTFFQPVRLAAGTDKTIGLSYRASGGRTRLRVALETADGERCRWTSLDYRVPEILSALDDLETSIGACRGKIGNLPPVHPLHGKLRGIAGSAREVRTAAQDVLRGKASSAGLARWRKLDARTSKLVRATRVLEVRADVAQRLLADRLAERHGPFVVVRSNPYVKIHRTALPAGPWEGPVSISGARGEGESIQLALVPTGRDLRGVRVTLSPFTQNGGGGADIPASAAEIYRVGYVHVKGPSPGVAAVDCQRAWWPDPLLPVTEPFDVRGVVQGIWIDLFIPRTATPGLYTGTVEIRAAEHSERVPIRLEVFDFALPVAHSLRQFFVLRPLLISRKYFGGDGDAYMMHLPLEKFFPLMDVFLKRRIGVQVFGNEWRRDPTAAMPYLKEKKTANGWSFDFHDTLRVLEHARANGSRTLFCGIADEARVSAPGYFEFLDAYLAAVQPEFERKGWMNEAVFYMVDEPWSAGRIKANIRLAAAMDRAAPQLKRLMTGPQDPRLDGLSQIWVPKGLPDAETAHPDRRRALEAWRKSEAEMWWYICCVPGHPYPNFFVDYPTLDTREVFWLTWKYHKTGFLYWGLAYHGDPKEMTPDGPTERYSVGPSLMGNGDGTLCYYAPKLGLYPSIRLDAVRDGLEDYEYFAMLRQLAERAKNGGAGAAWLRRAKELLAVDSRVIGTVDRTPNFTLTHDTAVLTSVRREMADLIQQLSVK